MANCIDVKTKVEMESEDVSLPLIATTCQMCLKDKAKYTCPRCNRGYCSVACYQSEKHSGCSEAFYKDWVLDELKETSGTPEDKKKVLEMLMKDLEDRTQEDNDEDEEDDLAQRLDGLDLDKDVSTVWSRLTPREKENFARMLQDGRLAKLIEIWTPWWLKKENQRLVLEETNVQPSTESSMIPEILSDVPDINDLLKNIRPSSNCRFDVINILHAYAYVARLHNGSHIECPVDATQDLLDTCCVLKKGSQCGSVGEAIQSAQDSLIQKAKSSEGSSPRFNLTVLKDVLQLLSGPGRKDSLTFVWAALSDVTTLFRTALTVVKKELKSKSKDGDDVTELKVLKSSLFKGEKKLVFLLSWSQRYGLGLHQLVPLLRFEIETRESEMEQVSEIKSAVEEHMDHLKPAPSETVSTQSAQELPSTTNEVPEKISSKIVELN